MIRPRSPQVERRLEAEWRRARGDLALCDPVLLLPRVFGPRTRRWKKQPEKSRLQEGEVISTIITGKKVEYQYARHTFEILEPTPLCPGELRTLIAILKLASRDDRRVTVLPGSGGNQESTQAAIQGLRMPGDGWREGEQVAIITTSLRELLRESHRGEKDTPAMRASLKALAATTIFETNTEGDITSYSLVAWAITSKGKVKIAINPRASAVLLKSELIAYLEPDYALGLDEHTLLLYTYLAAWVGPGRRERIHEEKLAKRVFPQAARRLAWTRKGVQMIGERQGWKIIRREDGMLSIGRRRT